MIWQLVGSELVVICGGVLTSVGILCDVKTKWHNRIRAHRLANLRSKLDDEAHVAWAQHIAWPIRNVH